MMHTGSCLALGVGLALLAIGPVGGNTVPPDRMPARPMNYTSHNEAFLRSLLAGRVWVFQTQIQRPEFRSIGAYALFPDGQIYKCLGRKLTRDIEGFQMTRGRWWIERQSIGAMFAQLDRDGKPEPYATPMFYSPNTGGLHTETNSMKVNAVNSQPWIVLARGWVQEGWPAAFRGPCPDVPLPEGMQIEERQTVLDWEEMRNQAPDAVVRNFRGSDLTSPGRTGLGRSNGAPTTSPRAAEAWLSAHEGMPLDHVSGRVVKIGPKRAGVVRTLRVLAGPADRAGARPLEPGDWRGSDADNGTDTPGEGRITRQDGGGLLIRIPGFRLELVPPGYPLPFMPRDARSVREGFDGAATDAASDASCGTGTCAGGFTGTATCTLDAEGNEIWDTTGCKRAE